MSSAGWNVPRLVRRRDLNLPETALTFLKSISNSPRDLLSKFPSSTSLTVKKAQHRFFMYEEHAPVKLQDDLGATETIQTSPKDFATLLESTDDDHHYYWTAPMASVAPEVLRLGFDWYEQLHNQQDFRYLDPRGPSLWMGTSGSGTQCHYDVANNILLQLHGTKRVRIFSPMMGISHLHVFPDAHPRARKSQVNFDLLDNDNTDERFPHFRSLPSPTLDVVLQPGDALSIPAFWFHHVENGRIPDCNNDDDSIRIMHGPSVSLNSFVLSEPMMIAQQIFQKGSRPLRGSQTAEQALFTLQALGAALIQGLGVNDDFIQICLLDARYAPLQHPNDKSIFSTIRQQELTQQQLDDVAACVERILPDFQNLQMEQGDNADGIVLLVALHLLELWAVEMVGAQSVAEAWSEALKL